jgi:hypothetical protein
MPRKKKVADVPIEQRRGVPCGNMIWNTWDMTLVCSGFDQSHANESDVVIDRLLKAGLVGVAKRNIGRDLLAGKLKPPAGKWALLIQLKGQPWLYLAPSWRDYSIAEALAEDAGLTTLLTGYQDTAGATFIQVRQGKNKSIDFESCGFKREWLKRPKKRREELSNTRFKSDRHKKDWWQQFKDEAEARDALVRELDAYVPMIGAGEAGGKIRLEAFDESGELSRAEFLRVDLLVFGPAEAMDQSKQGERLKKAIHQGDSDEARAAVAAGASLRVLPGLSLTPVEAALDASSRKLDKWIEVIRVLLESGADATGRDVKNPPFCVLANTPFLDEQTLIEGLRLLLNHGADPYAITGRSGLRPGSPLVHELAFFNRQAALKFFLTRGVDLTTKDAQGRTARQWIELRMKAMTENGISDLTDEQRTLELLRDIEAGREDGADYAELAAIDRLRHERGWREVRLAFAELGETLKAAGRVMRKPTKSNVARLAALTEPDRIKVIAGGRRVWVSPTARDKAEATLKKEGYKRIALFGVKEMPALRILAMLHPAEHVYAAVCETGTIRWIDLVRFHKDGSRLTVTNAKTTSEAQFSSRTIRKKRVPGTAVSRLLKAMREVKPPRAGVQAITAGEFAKRFEAAYCEEMQARRKGKQS